MTLRTTIKQHRSELGMTQDQLAKAVGVRRETIVFLESGKYNPSLRLAMDVSRELACSVEELFSFDG